MKHDTLSAPGVLPSTQDTGRAAAGRGPRSRRGAASGPLAELGVVDLETLAADLVRKLGPSRALLLASLIDETVAEAEGGA
jgi:hypothetical protein